MAGRYPKQLLPRPEPTKAAVVAETKLGLRMLTPLFGLQVNSMEAHPCNVRNVLYSNCRKTVANS